MFKVIITLPFRFSIVYFLHVSNNIFSVEFWIFFSFNNYYFEAADWAFLNTLRLQTPPLPMELSILLSDSGSPLPHLETQIWYETTYLFFLKTGNKSVNSNFARCTFSWLWEHSATPYCSLQYISEPLYFQKTNLLVEIL